MSLNWTTFRDNELLFQRTNLNLPANMFNNQRPVAQQNAANNVPHGSEGPIPVTNPVSMAELADTHYIVAEEFTLGVPMVCYYTIL